MTDVNRTSNAAWSKWPVYKLCMSYETFFIRQDQL